MSLIEQMAEDIGRYEEGLLEEEEAIELFSKLVNTGLVWFLQGHYGRTAQMLLDHGVIFNEN